VVRMYINRKSIVYSSADTDGAVAENGYSLVTARLIPMELHEWVGLRNNEARRISRIRDPKERIERASQAMEYFNGLADPSWVISQRWLSEIRVKARRETHKKGG